MKTDLLELVTLIEASLATIAEKVAIAQTMESGLADLLDLMEKRSGVDLAPLIAAVRDARPVVTVNVPPAPTPVVQVLPAVKGEWEVRKHLPHGGFELLMTVKKVA